MYDNYNELYKICFIDKQGRMSGLVSDNTLILVTVPRSPHHDSHYHIIWQIKGFSSVFTLNRLQLGRWIRVDFYVVMNWSHVPVVVQCNTDGCSLSSKDGAVVWQSFRPLATGCLTILEMAVDDCHCPNSHSLWSHQDRLNRMILVFHDTHWT